MSKRVIIIHCWSGSPEDNWYSWLKKSLEKDGFEVFVPQMPETDEPQIEKWVGKLAQVIGVPDESTYLVSHSIGGQTIMRYMEKLEDGVKIGGVVFVAGFFHLMDLPNEEFVIARPRLETKIDLEKVKSHCDKFTAIFSDNDPDVPISDKDIFQQKLDAKIVVEHNKGHFTAGDGVTELPGALVAINSFF